MKGDFVVAKKNNKSNISSESATASSELPKRAKRTSAEKIAELETKIAKAKESIEGYEAKIENLRNPKPRVSKKSKMKSVMELASKAGLTPEEIAEKLGIEL